MQEDIGIEFAGNDSNAQLSKGGPERERGYQVERDCGQQQIY